MKRISLQTLVVLFVFSALLLTTSCKKDEDVTPDKTELLTSGSWQMSALTIDPAIDWFGAPVTNVFAQLPTCAKDDLTIFKSNGIVNYDEGPSKCDLNAPQTTTGAWALNFDKTVLTISRDGDTESWDISALTETTFQAEYQVVEEGVTYNLSATFIRK